MPGHNRRDAERLSLIVETQREIAAAGHDLHAVMQLVAERSQAITRADGAMVNLIEGGDTLHTRAATGIAATAFDARRPLAHLRRLPIDEIKIDRSFVMRMDEKADDVTIVRSTIDLGRNLGLEVVAEGVETQAIWDKLRDLGCNVAQGYFLSRPVPPEKLQAWLEERRGGADEAAA
jgi:EAL domain-containing protein (putative c-di-GMP-specific phosphodiesterase class I)